MSKMEDLNKISTTKVGDSIHFYVNNKDSKGTVVKMDHSYITVLKDDGNFQHIHINDTFFVKDILINKTWNDMDATEQYDMLVNIHAPTPRFLGKKWEVLPKELKEALVKSTPEGGKVSGVNTGVKIPKGGGEDVGDAEEDYEGIHIEEDKEQFKHEKLKPTTKYNAWVEEDEDSGQEAYDDHMETYNTPDKGQSEAQRMNFLKPSKPTGSVPTGLPKRSETEDDVQKQFKHDKVKPTTKNNAMEASHKDDEVKEEWDGKFTSKENEYGQSDEEIENQNSVIGKPKIKKSWENWLEKEGGMGDGGSPATTQGRDSGYETFNPVYGKKQRHGGQSKDKEEDEMQEK